MAPGGRVVPQKAEGCRCKAVTSTDSMYPCWIQVDFIQSTYPTVSEIMLQISCEMILHDKGGGKALCQRSLQLSLQPESDPMPIEGEIESVHWNTCPSVTPVIGWDVRRADFINGGFNVTVGYDA